MASSSRIPEADRRTRLETLIGRSGLSLEQLLPHVSDAFGSPLLVVGTGSVPAGYGNQGSDIDLYAIVPEGDLSQLPIVGLEGDLRVDVRYFSDVDVKHYVQEVGACWPASGTTVTRRDWMSRRKLLETAARFATGITLSSRDEWSSWKVQLEGPTLQESVVDWWRIETNRRLYAARWLPQHSLGSDYRYVSLLCGAANIEVARAGHIFFGPKWLPLKVEQLGEPELLAIFRSSLQVPMEERTRHGILEFVERVAGDVEHLSVALHTAPGVRIDRFLQRCFVSRWQLRYVELPDDELSRQLGDGSEPVWTGPLTQQPPEIIMQLLAADLLWIAVGRVGSEGRESPSVV